MKNKLILSSILLIVLMLGLSTITAADTNSTTTTSIEKQTIDTTTPQITDNKEKQVTTNDNKEVKSSIKNTTTKKTKLTKDSSKEVSTTKETTKSNEVKSSSLKTKNTDNIKTNTKNLKSEDDTTIKTEEQTVTDFNSLKSAWNDTFTNGDNQTHYIINLKNGEYNFTEGLTVASTTNVKQITFKGEDKDKTILNGGKLYQIFKFDNSKLDIRISDITFEKGYGANGGAIYSVNNTITLDNTLFEFNKANRFGGAVYVNTGTINVFDSSFYNNTANSTVAHIYGGALYVYKGNLFVSECSFINNGAISNAPFFNANAGAIYADTDNATITKSFFDGNYNKKTSTSYGKGVLTISSGANTVSNCIFTSADYQMPTTTYANNYFMQNIFTIQNAINLALNDAIYNPVVTQDDNITLHYVIANDYDLSPVTEAFGLSPYKYEVTTDSPLLNTSGLYLSSENNYTVKLDTSSLKNTKFSDINIYVNGVKAGTIIYKKTEILQDNIVAKAGDTINITSYFNDGKNSIPDGKVAFKINSNTIGHANVTLGKATLTYTIPNKYTAKNYTINVVYGGTNNFNQERKNATLTLNRLNTTTTVTTSNVVANDTMKITVKTVDEHDNLVYRGKIAVKVNGKTVTLTNTTGIETVDFKVPQSWANRNITITAIYGRNSLYDTSRTDLKINVLPLQSSVKTISKSIKTVDVIDYYVSNDNGLDSNTGTITNPFKTIAKAINQTTADNIYNIHINGTYKGVGNTNLTVPGNHKINFIGEGINNTILDGEVNYTIGEASVWGGNPVWNPYLNGTGNWFMNITKGNGLITISDITIKNCWNPGGSNIEAYNTSTIDNYGNLKVDNVNFINNCGGVGAGIRSNGGSTLLVNNSVFDGNRKSSSTGNFGAGIYNNGTAVIINSVFKNNYARWGTITNDAIMNITNCTLQNNTAYDGGSSYKFGSGIVANTGGADFYNQYTIENLTTLINNCTFTRNDQTDIYALDSKLDIKNSNFINSSGIFANVYSEGNYYANIINNTFDGVSPSNLDVSLSSSETPSTGITARGKGNIVIDSNNIKVMSTDVYSYAISMTGSNNIINNITTDRRVIISGSYNKINNSRIITNLEEYAIQLSYSSKGNNISNNYLTSKSLIGTDSVNDIDNNYVLNNNNTPEITVLRLNDSTYNRYFDENGNYITSYGSNKQIQIVSQLTNKNLIFNNVTNITIYQQSVGRATSYNITIESDDATLNINKVKIINSNNKPVVKLKTDNNSILQSNFETNSNYTIELLGKNNSVTKNTLVADILVGNESVYTVNEENTISSNNPTYKNIVVTNDNYNQYFDENNTFIRSYDPTIEVHLLLSGNFYNKIFKFNTSTYIGKYREATVYNGTFIFKVKDNTYGSSLSLTNITIINTDDKNGIILTDNSISCNIQNNNITTKKEAILNRNSSCKINNNVIYSVEDSIKFMNLPKGGRNSISYNNITTVSTNKTHSIVISNVVQMDINYNNITTKGATNTTSIFLDANYPLETSASVATVSIESNDIKTIGNGNDDIIYSIYLNGSIKRIYSITKDNITTIGTKNAIGLYINIAELDSIFRKYNVFTISNLRCNVIASDYTSNIKVVYNVSDVSLNITNNQHYTKSNLSNIIDLTSRITENSTYGNHLMVINNNITSDSTNTVAFNLNNVFNSTIQNNTIKIVNDKGVPIKISSNSSYNIIKFNTILTSTSKTVNIDETSTKNVILYNTLITSNEYGDKTVHDEGQYNSIRDNIPAKLNSNYLLKDSTYYNYFDRNGVLLPEIKAGETLEVIGDLTNKKFIINKPINFIQSYGEIYNSTIILTENAKESNITQLRITNTNIDKTIIINTDNILLTIEKLLITNTNTSNNTQALIINGNNNKIRLNENNIISNDNTDVITINGDNNDLRIETTIITRITSEDKTANIIKIIGNSNKLLILSNGVTKSIDIYAPTSTIVNTIQVNGDYNQIELNKTLTTQTVERFTGIKLENSNYNNIILHTITSNIENSRIFYGILLIGSSYNTISNAVLKNSYNIYSNTYGLLITAQSNNNKISNITITNLDVEIDNSKENMLLYNTITTTKTYAIILSNTTDANMIKHNTLQSHALQGNSAVGADNLNNTIKYNLPTSNPQNKTTITFKTINNTAFIDENITITVNVVDNKNNPVLEGEVTFTANDKIIGKVNVTNGIASINYIIPPTNMTNYTITATYEDNDNYETSTITSNIMIKKVKTMLIVGNTTNKGSTATLTAILLDENGNIINNGKVAFKINGKTVGVSDITGGLALLSIDITQYNTGDYNITVVYGGTNYYLNISGVGILTINNYNVKMIVEPITTKTRNTIILRSYIIGEDNKPVNTGKAVFKLNSKTLKDEFGNIKYTMITNGIATMEYTLPNTMSAKTYTITSVAQGNNYEKVEANNTLTVEKRDTQLILEPQYLNRNTTNTIKAEIVDEQGELVVGTTKVAIKLNDKTIINTIATNGILNAPIDLTNYKNNVYNITIIAGENSLYNSSKSTNAIIIK